MLLHLYAFIAYVCPRYIQYFPSDLLVTFHYFQLEPLALRKEPLVTATIVAGLMLGDGVKPSGEDGPQTFV